MNLVCTTVYVYRCLLRLILELAVDLSDLVNDLNISTYYQVSQGLI